MLDWLIIGGGVHGTHLSLVLTTQLGVPTDRVGVLEPWELPMERWDECTRATGMRHLRSPAVHHLGAGPFALRQYAQGSGRSLARFFYPYERPALALFAAHCHHLVERHGLDRLRQRGWASGVTLRGDAVVVETTLGAIEARRLLLAIGTSEPHWPDWAAQLRTDGAPIDRVFAPGFTRDPPAEGRTVVVGGGLSAAQTALALARQQPGRVTLLMRHAARVHHFDSDPCWLGPGCLYSYRREPDYAKRRAQLRAARHRGSMPSDVHRSLSFARARGLLRWEYGAVEQASLLQKTISLRTAAETFSAERVILATGFESRRAGGAWLDRAPRELALPCAECGYPILDKALRWHARIHVTGPLAELELGPAARNIIGARMTAERLTQFAA